MKLVRGVLRHLFVAASARFSAPMLYLPDLAGDAAADVDRDHAAGVEADAPAVEQRRRAVDRARVAAAAEAGAAASRRRRAPKSKMPRPSRKKSRFSGNCRLKRVRFSCCSSTSTCAKSVFTVTSAVRFAVMPYFASSPTSASDVVRHRRRPQSVGRHPGDAVRLQLDVLARPAADRVRRASPRARRGRCSMDRAFDAGSAVRCVHSFLRRIERRS